MAYLDEYSVSISRDPSLVGGLVYTTDLDSNLCVRFLEAVGNTAAMVTFTTCSELGTDPVYGPYTFSVVPSSETLTFQGGTVMTENSTRSLRYAYGDGTYLDCTSTISGVTLHH
jgi:hypothetical protein